MEDDDANSKTAYYFRLRFHLPQYQTIKCDDVEVEIPTEGDLPNLLLKSHEGAVPIGVAHRLVLSGGPYASEQNAYANGLKARYALMRYSVQARVAIDLGKNRSTGGLSKYLKDKIKSDTGKQILDDVHGLQVYQGATETRFAFLGSPSLNLGNQFNKFLGLFQQAHSLDFSPTDKEEVAFELFAAAQFEHSRRARFLTLVMAIEALLRPEDSCREVREHVQSMIKQTTQSDLSCEDKQSLVSRLDWLLKDSIGRTGRQLSDALLTGREYGGKSPGAYFQYCYSLRSQLVHNGAVSDDAVQLGTVAAELGQFVADLLEASIRPVEK